VLRRLSLIVLLVVSLPAVATAGPVADVDSASEPPDRRNAASDPLAVDASADVDSTEAAETITRTTTLRLTPEEPGRYEAVVRYDVPDSVTSLDVTLGSESTVTAADGFERSGSDTWAWTESTDSATLTLSVDANETATGRRAPASGGGDADASAPDAAGVGGPSAQAPGTGSLSIPSASADEGLAFADAGSWALVRLPRLGTSWRWSGTEDVGLAKGTTVDGPGATGGSIAYLGEVRRYEASARGESFQLVVPERAELRESPDAILASLTAASDRLRVGGRSDRVVVFAAPGDVDWGVAGIQYGDDDAWVVADAELSTASNAWLHEYVHTRQGFETTESGAWTVEATAEYYAALLAFEQGRVSYAEFREKLERGGRDRYDDDVLASPSTWSGGANYLKGSLAAGAIDLRMRQATDRSATLQSAFRKLNGYNGTVSNGVFLDAVGDAAGASVRSTASELTRTERTADAWSEGTHGEYFGDLPAVFEYEFGTGALAAAGVVGERSLSGDSIALARGETLAVAVGVRNVGWEAGTYETALAVDGAVVDERAGELAANGSTTETFERTFDEPGTYTVSVADRRIEVRVVEAAEPVVASVDAPDRVAAGEDVQFTVTYRNDAAVPGNVTAPFVVDGEEVAERTVQVPAERQVKRTYTLSLSPGGHEVRVGDASVAVTVEGETDDGADGEPVPDVPTPGFGAAGAAVALVGLGALLARRRR